MSKPEASPERQPCIAKESKWRSLTLALLAVLIGAGVGALIGQALLPAPPADGPIGIAAVYSIDGANDKDTDDFLTGIQIAIDQVNAEGGLLGRPLALLPFREDVYVDPANLSTLVAKTLKLASRIAQTPSVLAVLGHEYAATAVTASAVYDRHGLLYFATHATVTSLSSLSFSRSFVMQPSNADNAAVLADYARKQNLRRMVVLSDNSNYGMETTAQFRTLLTQSGGTVLFRGHLTTVNRSVNDMLLFLLDNDDFDVSEIDAFFVTSSDLSETVGFITHARQLGLNIPILGPEYLTSQKIEERVPGRAMHNVVSVTSFDDAERTDEGIRLHDAFFTKTGRIPGLWTAVGFDSIKVLANAVSKTKTLDTGVLADAMRIARYDSPYIGAAGPVAFNASGLITDMPMYIVRHDGTRFNTVATYMKPIQPEDADGRKSVLPTSMNQRSINP